MFKEKQNLLKVAIGALVLSGVFAGMYLGANNFAFVAATDEIQNSEVYEPTHATHAEEIVLLVEDEPIWTESDEEAFLVALREEIRNEILESIRSSNEWAYEWALENEGYEFELWEPTDEEIEEWIGFHMSWRASTTPRPHHLTEEEMTAIAIQWVYEEFGVLVDMATMLDEYLSEQGFWSEFHYGFWEERAFWTGSFSFWDVDYDSVNNFYNLTNNFAFAMDGTTGERIMIEDTMLPFEPVVTEITWEQTQVTVLDYTIVNDISNPWHTNMTPQPFHLSIEELVTIIMETVSDTPDINLDKLTINANFWGNEYAESWFVRIPLEAPFLEGSAYFQARESENTEGLGFSFYYDGQCSNVNHQIVLHIDARTGEITYFEDSRELPLGTALQLCSINDN